MKIYLAGFIQGNKIKECSEWRIKIRKHYENYKGARYPIDWLDPLNGKEFDMISGDGLSSELPKMAILYRDYMSVKNADVIVANMDTFGENRPLTGTICELAWAWEKKKPIIMITDEKKYAEHPFLKNFASVIVKDVDTLLREKWINMFYKGVVNAIY